MRSRNVLIIAPSAFLRESVVFVLEQSKFIVSDEEISNAGSLCEDIKVTPDIVVGIGTNARDIDTVTEQIRAMRTRFQDVKSAVITNQLASSEVLKALEAGVDAILSMDLSFMIIRSSLELVMTGHRIFPALPAHLPAFHADAEPVKTDRVSGDINDLQPFEVAMSASDLAPLSERLGDMSGQIVQFDRPRSIEPSPGEDSIDPLVLSDREKQILRCLVAGLPNKLIARELEIAETTVKVHVKSVLRKVRAANRTQAAMWAVSRQAGLMNDPNWDKKPVVRACREQYG
jgi:two-component system, NarL family, nitrate/nitrite response regulator NarL